MPSMSMRLKMLDPNRLPTPGSISTRHAAPKAATSSGSEVSNRSAAPVGTTIAMTRVMNPEDHS